MIISIVLLMTRVAVGFDAPLLPAHTAYVHLTQALSRYQTLARTGGWFQLVRSELRAADFRARVLERLQISGDHPAPAAIAAHFPGDPVAAAVAAFQYRHGLPQLGTIGPLTLAALNVPVEMRIRQIERTLARWHGLGRELGEHYLFINIPAYQARLVENGVPSLTFRVIVGSPHRPTPTLISGITHVIINPHWTIPRSIATAEFLPALKLDPAYLDRHHLSVIDANGQPVTPPDWRTTLPDFFDTYWLRQAPGSFNALGSLKFIFPSRYAIYLHDTNRPSYFDRSTRALSHGCIRIENPQTLAVAITRKKAAYTVDELNLLFQGRAQVTVPLTEPLLIYIQYLTVEADGEGTVFFWPDIYGKDGAVASAR